jgi:hypothetical protein
MLSSPRSGRQKAFPFARYADSNKYTHVFPWLKARGYRSLAAYDGV